MNNTKIVKIREYAKTQMYPKIQEYKNTSETTKINHTTIQIMKNNCTTMNQTNKPTIRSSTINDDSL